MEGSFRAGSLNESECAAVCFLFMSEQEPYKVRFSVSSALRIYEEMSFYGKYDSDGGLQMSSLFYSECVSTSTGDDIKKVVPRNFISSFIGRWPYRGRFLLSGKCFGHCYCQTEKQEVKQTS